MIESIPEKPWQKPLAIPPLPQKMLFYELPKEKLTYGPKQVGAIWDQKGLGVIRGKPVVIRIKNSFPSVVPLSLRAEGTNFPQLKRVIVATVKETQLHFGDAQKAIESVKRPLSEPR